MLYECYLFIRSGLDRIHCLLLVRACASARVYVCIRLVVEIVKCAHTHTHIHTHIHTHNTLAFLWQKSGWNITGFFKLSSVPSILKYAKLLSTSPLPPPSPCAPLLASPVAHSEFGEYEFIQTTCVCVLWTFYNTYYSVIMKIINI